MPTSAILMTAALCGTAAVLGLWLGSRAMPSEGDAIAVGAALYVEETGGAATDCVGLPAEGTAWIEVRCAGVNGLFVYVFDRRVRLMPDSGVNVAEET